MLDSGPGKGKGREGKGREGQGREGKGRKTHLGHHFLASILLGIIGEKDSDASKYDDYLPNIYRVLQKYTTSR